MRKVYAEGLEPGRAGNQASHTLQADGLTGIWAHSAYAQGDLLESGDLEEGLNAAAAVGDDRIQKQAGQGVNPESFTHGQRVKWFRAGFDGGDPTSCDTFKGDV